MLLKLAAALLFGFISRVKLKMFLNPVEKKKRVVGRGFDCCVARLSSIVVVFCGCGTNIVRQAPFKQNGS